MNVEPTFRAAPPRSGKVRRRLISVAWFVAIICTVSLAGAMPLVGFPVALGLIFLSIVFPGENPCATGDPNEHEHDRA